MEETKGRVIPITIEDEVKTSYLNYAMSVIVSRALPDVRDGLKPVHRRILYTMSEMGLRHDRAFKKCGRIVGDVLGKYHPHGDQSIYDALVRLAQDFSLRYPVVRPQGNFGSVDGDPPAAMRYTEAKMAHIAEEMLRDIKKETVDFVPNYDDSMLEPSVLPSAFPFLMVNGASGIAVGMATNMAPHNLGEIGAAINAYVDNPDISVEELMQYVSGPDFPTGGIIYGKKGIEDAYRTGRGKITIRSKYTIEEIRNRTAIIVTEIPYAVNKATLLVKIAELVKAKKIEGIADLRDESDRNGMRIVIELKNSAIPKVVLNLLFAKTALQSNFHINNLALVDGRPQTLSLRDLVHYFVKHRVEVITRRSQYELEKARRRAHILEGLKIALENIDEVIKIIKESSDVPVAKERLMATFGLSELQTQAILDMRLQKLTSLETQKILDELAEVQKYIDYLEDLLSSEAKIRAVVREETEEIVAKHGDERQSALVAAELGRFNEEDLIAEEDVVVVLTNKGFIKRTPLSAYKLQQRGGRGARSAKLKDEDFVENLFIASTHEYLIFVTSAGRAHTMKVYEIPEASRQAKGTHIRALLALESDEEVRDVVATNKFDDDTFLFFATARGTIKRCALSNFAYSKTRGINAITLLEGDKLVTALKTGGSDSLMLVTANGYALRFDESLVRPSGRTSQGVRGIKLRDGDYLTEALIANDDDSYVVLTENGFGKRGAASDFTIHGRGGQGQFIYNCSDETGAVVSAMHIEEDMDVMCITASGLTVKMELETISVQGRKTRGVRCVRLGDSDRVIAAAVAPKVDEDQGDDE